MIIVTGRIVVREGALQKLRPAMEAMIKASRSEPGCLEYYYGTDLTNADAFIVLEKWETWEALDAHFERPHLKAWRAALAALGLVSRDMIAADEREMKEV
jgi:quinol monooxygenase YgiN